MRRNILLAAAVAAVGLAGCKHVGGTCDCGHDPANASLYNGGGTPYPTVGAPITGTATPEKMPAPLGAPAAK